MRRDTRPSTLLLVNLQLVMTILKCLAIILYDHKHEYFACTGQVLPTMTERTADLPVFFRLQVRTYFIIFCTAGALRIGSPGDFCPTIHLQLLNSKACIYIQKQLGVVTTKSTLKAQGTPPPPPLKKLKGKFPKLWVGGGRSQES